jgi:hypothetical protein
MLCILCGAAFPRIAAADDDESARDWTVTVDSVVDALYMRAFFGDYAVREPADKGTPFVYQGNGDIRAFGTSAFDDPLNANVTLKYAGQAAGALLQVKADTDTTTLLDTCDWEAWLRIWRFRAAVGNQGQRGQVERYQNFDDFLKTKVDSLGVLVPTWKRNPPVAYGNNFDVRKEFPYGYPDPNQNKGFAAFAGSDTNDLFQAAGATSADTRPTPAFLLDAEFAPLTVSLSAGGLFDWSTRPFLSPWSAGDGSRLNDWDNLGDVVTSRRAGFGIRVEGARLFAPLNLTAAAVYKYADSYLTKLAVDKAADEGMILDEQVHNHDFGLYVNLAPLHGLGISAGFSGIVKTWDNPRYDKTLADPAAIGEGDDVVLHYLSAYRSVAFPFYSGFDLRVQYTGVDNLTLTCNNNLSFARSRGTDNRAEKFAKGWAYENQLNADEAGAADRAERYLGLYNAIGARYQLTARLGFEADIANQLGFFTLDWENGAVSSSTEMLGVYAGAAFFAVNSARIRASLRGGFCFRLNAYTYQDAISGSIYRASYTEFGIPIGLKVEF